MLARRQSTKLCRRFQSAADLVAKRWSPLIVQVLLKGPRRYSELVAELEVVTEGMLSQRLKELEGAGVVERRVIGDQPVRVEYHLTEMGRGLGRVISDLEQWAEKWIP